MKEATKLLIETGIIPDTVVKLCRIWNGGLDGDEVNEMSDTTRQRTHEELRTAIQRVAELLENEDLPEMKEAELDLDDVIKYAHLKGTLYASSNSGHEMGITIRVGFTKAGKMALKVEGSSDYKFCERFAQKGNVIMLSNGKMATIKHVEPRYKGDELSHYVCDVEVQNA